jgi:hypothetical protein
VSAFHSRLKRNYDKLLHVLGLFVAMLWLDRFLPIIFALLIVLCLCLAKSAWNQYENRQHGHFGDWISNITGLLMYAIWLWI